MSDTQRFIEKVRPLFGSGEVLVTRAPGRIDLMGGIADYSGSLVLQWPIAAATHVALQLQKTPIDCLKCLSLTFRRQPTTDLHAQSSSPTLHNTGQLMLRALFSC